MQVVVTLQEAKQIERLGGSYVWEMFRGEPTGRCIATLPPNKPPMSGRLKSLLEDFASIED